MAEAEGDPFLWDIDRVVQELCTTNRSWQAPPANKLPDPASLEASIREQEIDGETLLTYADTFDAASLWEALGIKKAPHKLSIHKAIIYFQKRSPGFRQWKLNQRTENQSDDEDDGMPAGVAPRHGTAFAADSNGVALAESLTVHAPQTPVTTAAEPSPQRSELTAASIPSHRFADGAKRGRENDAVFSVPATNDTTLGGPTTKKRRVAPTQVSPTPMHSKRDLPPTEADNIQIRDKETVFAPLITTAPSYLGAAKRCDHVADHSSSDGEDQEFSWSRCRPTPPGRRIQMMCAMKRRLLSSPFVVPQVELTEDDEVLPVFGESDDEQSLDSETWEAIQREEERKQRRKAAKLAAKESQLSADKIKEAVARTTRRLESDWLSTKKPKYDQKARKIWNLGRLNPNRHALIAGLKTDCEKLEARIKKFTEEIASGEWQDEAELDKMVPDHLSVSIDELQQKRWKIKLLENPLQPPRVKAPTGPKGRRHRTPENSDEDEESLSSDIDNSDDSAGSEMEMDNLMVNDQSVGDPMEVDTESPRPEPPELPDRLRTQRPDKMEIERERSSEDPPPRSPPPKLKFELPAPATPRRVSHLQDEVIEIQSSPMHVGNTSDVNDAIPAIEKPPLDDVERIAEIGAEAWQMAKDRERLIIAVLAGLSPEPRAVVLGAMTSRTVDEVWDEFIDPWVVNTTANSAKFLSDDVTSPSFLVARLLDAFISSPPTADRMGKKMRQVTIHRIVREREQFTPFCRLLSRVSSRFLAGVSHTPTRIKLVSNSGSQPQEAVSQTDTVASGLQSDEEFSSESTDEDTPPSLVNKRRRKRGKDKAAEALRRATAKKGEEFEKRRQAFRLEQESGTISGDKRHLVVNVTKEHDQAFIYINDRIGSKIKEHQIEGVRFLWDHLVNSDASQGGCLLAHEMGLGKTMQAITLLVVIAESAQSEDPSVRSQIPKHLRKSKTLILCPSGLVDNWFDELTYWASEETLGRFRRMPSTISRPQRVEMIKNWAQEGGVLVIGYNLFTKTANDEELNLGSTLRETPNIVIADEAHQLKNSGSQRAQAAANFRTESRIALTGSPLTSNVMDYHAMINWAAPNYLADISEFKRRFGDPIKEGLYSDSTAAAKRKARKMLHILNVDVSPKVHRRDVQVLRETLPGKKEFIICLPLNKLQLKAYNAYLDMVGAPSFAERLSHFNSSKIWSLVSLLSTLLAHPQIFKLRVEERKKALEEKRKKALQDSKNNSNGDVLDDVVPAEHLSLLLEAVSNERNLGDPRHSYKMQVLFQILDESRKMGDKVLVFSHCLGTLNYLENAFKLQKRNFSRLDGSTPVEERQKAVKKFNGDPSAEIYLISTTAGGVGLNIYGANRVVIFDFKYTPSEQQQAIGRAYRIGQSKPVFVYWLHTEGTFEKAILNNAVFKTQLASRVVDKKNPDPYANMRKEYFFRPTIPDQEDLTLFKGKDRVLDALISSEKLSGVVKNIITTDTFEKEEVFELSAEDKREAEADIEMERLRRTNPEEYKRRELLARMAPLSMYPIPVPAFHQHVPPQSQAFPSTVQNGGASHVRPLLVQPSPSGVSQQAMPGLSTSGTTQNSASSHLPPPLMAPLAAPAAPAASQKPVETKILPSQHAPLTVPDAPTTAPRWHPPLAAQEGIDTAQSRSSMAYQTGRGQQSPLRTSASTRSPFSGRILRGPNSSPVVRSKHSELEPIRGSGTHFKHTLEAPSQTKGQEDLLLTCLCNAHSRLHAAGRATAEPRELLSSVGSALDKAGFTSVLPRLDKLQNLNKVVQETRFADAVMAGYIKPGQLAELGRAQLLSEAERLKSMEESAFIRMVWPSATPQLSIKPEPHSSTASKTDLRKLRPATTPPVAAQSYSPLLHRKRRPGDFGGVHQQAGIKGAASGTAERPKTSRPNKRSRGPRPGDSADSPQVID